MGFPTSKNSRSYTKLSEAKTKTGYIISVAGVVTDCLGAMRTGGSDYAVTFELKDRDSIEVGMDWGLKIRIFARDEAQLPPVESPGDVVLIQEMKVANFRGEIMGISNHRTKWAVFSEKSIQRYLAKPTSALEYRQTSNPISLTSGDLALAVDLYRECQLGEVDSSDVRERRTPIAASIVSKEPLKNDACLGNSRAMATTENNAPSDSANRIVKTIPSKRQKFSLIEKLESSGEERDQMVFADLCCEVRKIYDEYDKVNLSVTDYTKNRLLFNYANGCEDLDDGEDLAREGDPYGHCSKSVNTWKGPWGRMTLNITVFDNNAQWIKASKLKPGDYIFIHNVHIKYGSNGSLLEGKLRDDIKFPEKVLIRKMLPKDKEEVLDNLLRRKLLYEKRYKQLYDKTGPSEKDPKKRPLADIIDDIEEKAQKKSRRQMKKEQKKRFKQQDGSVEGHSSSRTNENVRCNQIDKAAFITINDILHNTESLNYTPVNSTTLTLPFQNVCYKSKARVVDFFPPSLTNFAAAYNETDYEYLSKYSAESSSSDSGQDPSNLKWEWRFCLLVEDPSPPSQKQTPKPQMLLHVSGTDGQFLLNEDACDLRRNPQVLERVRQKLFHFWGDLEEDKQAAAAAADPKKTQDGNEPAKEAQNTTSPRSSGGIPFECLIKEYGIRKRRPVNEAGRLEYERMFRLWGVTIP